MEIASASSYLCLGWKVLASMVVVRASDEPALGRLNSVVMVLASNAEALASDRTSWQKELRVFLLSGQPASCEKTAFLNEVCL